MGKGKAKQLEEWSITFKKQLKYMHALTNRLSRIQFNYKPKPDKWSVGECIEHLNLSTGAYLKIMRALIKEADLQTTGEYDKGTMMGRIMLWALRKPGGRFPAPKSFMPKEGEYNPNSVRDAFDRQIARLRQTLEECEGLALGSINMPWPVFRLIKLSLAQAFELQILHTDRHLKQAERVIQREDFPRPTSVNSF